MEAQSLEGGGAVNNEYGSLQALWEACLFLCHGNPGEVAEGCLVNPLCRVVTLNFSLYILFIPTFIFERRLQVTGLVFISVG